MKVKTSELADSSLDWAVAKCEGILTPIHGEPEPRVVLYSDRWQKYMRLNPRPQVYYSDRYEPSTDPVQAWPIIERLMNESHMFFLENDKGHGHHCALSITPHDNYHGCGPTPLIAAMRCFVASKLGDEVEIPEELVT